MNKIPGATSLLNQYIRNIFKHNIIDYVPILYSAVMAKYLNVMQFLWEHIIYTYGLLMLFATIPQQLVLFETMCVLKIRNKIKGKLHYCIF